MTPRPLPRWMDSLPSKRKLKTSYSHPPSPPTTSTQLSALVNPPSPSTSSVQLSTSSSPSPIPKLPLTTPPSLHRTIESPSPEAASIPELRHNKSPPSSNRSNRRLFFPPAPPAYAPSEETVCAACRLPLLLAEARTGPGGTFLHQHCMLCARCGEQINSEIGGVGGDGVWDEEGFGYERTCTWCAEFEVNERRREGKRGRRNVTWGFDGLGEEEEGRGIRRSKRRRGWRWCCGGRR